MQLPPSFLDSLESVKGFDRVPFEKLHESGEQVTSIRLNPSKPVNQFPNSQSLTPNSQFPIPWTHQGFYLSQRPSFTFDPLFHAGCYYVQEASGMFLEQALKQTVDLSKPLKVLDLCAAPGGKSTHIQSLISKDSLLVSNETIRARANILKDNIIRWGSQNVMVTYNDPGDFSKLENYFDVIVIDAPCSGSGLIRREPDAIHEWSENNVKLCSHRQQRILANAWPALKKNGILIYSTCSFSKEEDEEIGDWIMEQLDPGSNRNISLQLAIGEFPGIVETRSEKGAYGYRFFPDKIKGEGFYIACFGKRSGTENSLSRSTNKPASVSKKEALIVADWVTPGNIRYIKNQDTVYAWPEILFDPFVFLLNNLRVIYSGTLVGELVRDKLIPDHSIAMSGLVSDRVIHLELNYDQAIQYLQRKEFRLETKHKGWQLVTYAGYALGWVNVLSNRINNYYPKELRILKEVSVQ